MPFPSRSLASLAMRAGVAASQRRLGGTQSLLGRAATAARTYAGQLGRMFRPTRRDATQEVQQIARRLQVQPRSMPGAPPVVPGLSDRLAQQRTGAPPAAFNRPSPATEELRTLVDQILGRTSIGQAEAQQLAGRVVNLLRLVRADPAVALDQRRALEDIAMLLEHRFAPPETPPTAPAPAGEDEESIEVMGRADIGRWDDRQVAEAMENEVFTPSSSNVYSFFWVSDQRLARSVAPAANGTLFVTFKLWHPGMSRKRGGTGERPNSAGPTYAYSNVPHRKYQQFAEAAESSAGGAVWDYLRVRGSRYGHQHPYRLSSGAMIPGGGEYVPRKITAAGLRKRSLLNPKAGWSRSQLPEEMNGAPGANYTYAQWREIARQRNVDRGRPEVDRGR